jgi:hypothetical protein
LSYKTSKNNELYVWKAADGSRITTLLEKSTNYKTGSDSLEFSSDGKRLGVMRGSIF